MTTAITTTSRRARRRSPLALGAALRRLLSRPPLPAAGAAAAALVGLTAVTAIAVRLVAADDARRLLDLGFDGVDPGLSTAAAIFANNVRVLTALAAACVVVQLRQREPDSGAPGLLLAAVAAVCDGAVLVGCLLHVGVIGSAFGAYGTRTLTATIAHGPAELAAFALLLGLHLTARRRVVPARTMAVTALAAVAALALAALLEAFA
jgi:hypothetical protein